MFKKELCDDKNMAYSQRIYEKLVKIYQHSNYSLWTVYMLQFKRGSENIYFLKSFADFKALYAASKACVIGYYLILKILLLYLDCIDLAYFKE